MGNLNRYAVSPARTRRCRGTARASLLLCCTTLVAMGCGGDGAGMEEMETPKATPRRPGEKVDPWQAGTVIAREAGLHPEIVVTGDGNAAVAYYATKARDMGLCDEIEGDDLPMRMLWDLWYAQESATGFAAEPIGEVLSFNVPQGLDMAVDPAGAPAVATLTGGPHVALRFCSANDVGFYRRVGAGNWQVTAAVRTSGEAATGDAASDYGEVVGHWPGLAIDASGNAAIAYKDVHAGGIQNDDLERADLEVALQNGGGWRAVPVDWGKGAGSYNRALFDAEG
ncbi:MAG: hypothetical protein OXU20_29480, partial [Myxococcales bacterium]|nr:hypothetical protein [Myxococcales bacterium]